MIIIWCLKSCLLRISLVSFLSSDHVARMLMRQIHGGTFDKKAKWVNGQKTLFRTAATQANFEGFGLYRAICSFVLRSSCMKGRSRRLWIVLTIKGEIRNGKPRNSSCNNLYQAAKLVVELCPNLSSHGASLIDKLKSDP